MGLLLPLGQVWSAEGAATSGWQVTPFFGCTSSLFSKSMDEL